MANFNVIYDTTRFKAWKAVLDKYEDGEITDFTASKLLDSLREKERKQFEESQRK